MNLVSPSTVVSQAARCEANIHLGHGESLAVIQGLDSGESVDVLIEERSEFVKVDTSGGGVGGGPYGVEGFSGGLDGNVDI